VLEPVTDRTLHGSRGIADDRRRAASVEVVSKAVVLASLAAAVACEAWLGRPAWNYLPQAVALAALAGILGGRFAPWSTSAAVLFFTYTTPVVFALTLHRFQLEFLLVWSAALTGVVVGDAGRWRWSYPRRWRFALILWAVTVALAWPLTALRELDFSSLALLERYNVANTGIGGGPRLVIMWGADAAIIHLLGLLWFNWLFTHAARRTDRAFDRWIAWPLATSMVIGCFLGLYQGLFDLGFLSVGVWPMLHRAAGSLLDANAFGMAAALWTAGFLALAGPSRRERVLAAAGAVLCWGAMWMSGSRTALAAAAVALALAFLAGVRRRVGSGIPRRLFATGAGAILVLTTITFVVGSGRPDTPLARLRGTLPSEISRPAISAFVREMWNRNGYGQAATALIEEHPATGMGIGLFNLEGSAYFHSLSVNLPPDNAQNWWRHHVAELGFVGAAGLILWSGVFIVFLLRTSGEGGRRVPAAALKGALIGLGLASLVGMPAQSLSVSMTFWMFAFWYTRLLPPGSEHDSSSGPGWRGWSVLVGVALAYAITLVVLARGDERPAMRAAIGNWRYTYGMYDPGPRANDNGTVRWTERHGVSVVANRSPWMVLTVRAQHPDLLARPVHARVTVNGRTVVDRALHTDAPIVQAIGTGTAERDIIESGVDRTWRPAGAPDNSRDVGLSLSWTFVAEPPAGVPSVTAPFRR